MPEELSVHDNNVYGYRVDCESRRIVLHTEFRHREPVEFTDVVFRDVVAHYFEHVLDGNILFDVAEVGVSTLVREQASVLKTSWQWGWPPIEYGGDLDVLVATLRQHSVQAYEVSSSYGLGGWVLAGGCDRVPRAARATFD